MKKVKSLLALSVFLAAMALPVFEAQSQSDRYTICFYGKNGEVGTWTEGACIENPVVECIKCSSWEVEE